MLNVKTAWKEDQMNDHSLHLLPETYLAELVDQANEDSSMRSSLIEFLPEKNPIYQGRGTNQVNRMRGYLMAALEHQGCPDRALVYLLEVLENSRDAYMMAAAAKALRGQSAPSPFFTIFLIKGVINIQYIDQYLTFDCYQPRWPLNNHTTALTELFKTFQWMGAYARKALPNLQEWAANQHRPFSRPVREEILKAIQEIEADLREIDDDCCEPLPLQKNQLFNSSNSTSFSSIQNLVLEDQSGTATSLGSFLQGQPCLLTFFYTRCPNPNKCSLTISKLGLLQKKMQAAGIKDQIKILAISYDSGFDLPARLKTYGLNRDFRFSPFHKIGRILEGRFSALRDYLNLSVNYSGSIVNVHAIEMYILDAKGNIAHSYGRLQWDIEEVIQRLKEVAAQPELAAPAKKTSAVKSAIQMGWSLALPVFVAFFPKCPLCWAAYMSLFGLTSLQSIPYTPWLKTLFTLLLFVNLVIIYLSSKRRKRLLSFVFSLIGTAFILMAGFVFDHQFLLWLGFGLIFISSLLISLSYLNYLKIWRYLEKGKSIFFAKEVKAFK